MLRCVHSVFSPTKVEVPALPTPCTATSHSLLLLSCLPFGKHPVLSISITTASRAMAEPLHPSPWHQALAAQHKEWLQQWMLSLLAVHTAQPEPSIPVLLLPNSHPSFRAASHGDAGAPFPTHLQFPPHLSFLTPMSCWRQGSPGSLPETQQLWESTLPRSWENIMALSPATSAPSVLAGQWGLSSSAGTQLIRSFQ